MEFDFENNPVGALFAIIIFVIVGSLLITYLATVSNIFKEEKCQSYTDTINQKDVEISGLRIQLNQTRDLLFQCNSDYVQLMEEKITKQDFQEIKGYYNLTQIQINYLDQKFEQVLNNFNKVNNSIIHKYTFHFTLNILFGIEILSFLILKNEFVFFVINLFRKKKKENKKNETDHP